MEASDSQRQLLTLIRDFASEKSQGERRIVGLKKRIQELRSEFDAVNVELEDAKHLKETTEQELKGYEVELSMNEASIQTLEARISLIQDKISVVGSDVEALKNEEGTSRDDFTDRMFELNTNIRKFQETVAHAFQEENQMGMSSNDGYRVANAEDARKAFENKLAQLISQTDMEEQEYKAEQDIHSQVLQELIDLKRKVFLMEEIMKESIALQDLTRVITPSIHVRCVMNIGDIVFLTGNKQISEFEETCASLGEELQRRGLCPSCHLDNVEALGGILQAGDGN